VDEPVMMVSGVGTKHYFHQNHLYSVAAMTSSTGAVVERYRYDAYGKRTVTNAGGTPIAASTIGQQRGFSGYYLDAETGLYYARARMYSAELGRFVNRDPYRQSVIPMATDGYPDGFSLYAAYFVPGSMDPTGMGLWDDYWDAFDDTYGLNANSNTEGESQISGILSKIANLQDYWGTKGCFNIVSGPWVVSVCVSAERRKCCKDPSGGSNCTVSTWCTVGEITVDGGAAVPGTVRPGMNPKPKRWLAPVGPVPGVPLPVYFRVPFKHGFYSGCCPPEGIAGEVSATASVGSWGLTAGIKGTIYFPGGGKSLQYGLGIGQGTGVYIGGGIVFTHCDK